MKYGYQVKQDKVHEAVVKLLNNNPMTAKEMSEIRGTNQNSSCTLLKVMQGKGLVKKQHKVKIGNYKSIIWAVAEHKIIDIKPKNVYEFNLMMMVS